MQRGFYTIVPSNTNTGTSKLNIWDVCMQGEVKFVVKPYKIRVYLWHIIIGSRSIIKGGFSTQVL